MNDKAKIHKLLSILHEVNHSIDTCKSNTGAVYLGDKTEQKIKDILQTLES